MTAMNTYSMESNASILSYNIDDDKVIDYGYEDHGPDVRLDHLKDAGPELKLKVPVPTSAAFYIAGNFPSISSHGGKDSSCTTSSGVGNTDATEVSQSPSQRLKGMWSGTGASKPIDEFAHDAAFMSEKGFHLECDGDDDDEDDDSSYDNIRDEDVIENDRSVGTSWSGDQQQATSQLQRDDNSMTNDDSSSLYPPMPPDRQARKQRSFRRRGGELHGALLKSAVMASMSFDYDDSNDEADGTAFRNARRESCHSSISLQSLQDALRSETSPRKRARRGQRRKSFDDDDETHYTENDKATTISTNNDANQNDDTIEASDLFVNMRVGTGRISGNSSNSKTRSSGNSSGRRTNSGTSHFHGSINSCSFSDFNASADMVVAEIVREAPPRRVSRKKSYDSRASDYDSDFDTDEWDL